MPAELAEWAQDTMLATAAGMVLGGGMQWREERAAGPVQAPPGAPSKAHAAKAMAEEQTQRLLRIINSSIKSSLRFGSLAAVFYGVQLAGGIYRGRHDFINSAAGGMAAGAVLGSSLSRFIKKEIAILLLYCCLYIESVYIEIEKYVFLVFKQ